MFVVCGWCLGYVLGGVSQPCFGRVSVLLWWCFCLSVMFLWRLGHGFPVFRSRVGGVFVMFLSSLVFGLCFSGVLAMF